MALGIWSKLQSLIFGTAIGAASADAIAPVLEPVKQHANLKNPYRVLDVGTVAELIAEGALKEADAVEEAKRTGYDKNRLDALIRLAQTAPDVAQALEAWNRGKATEASVNEALAKHKIAPAFWPAVKELRNVHLSMQDVANAIVRGVIKAPFPLPGPQRDQPGKVEAFPQSTIDALEEITNEKWNEDRLFVLTAIAGRPMGPEGAADAYFKGIIEHADYIRAVAEGDVRTEWAEFMLDNHRKIPSPVNYVENYLRGYSHEADMYAGTAKHGMSEHDTNIIFQNAGRPLAIHQITTALERGGQFHPNPSGEQDPFQAAVHESDIKPEYYDLAIANKYTYPSAFAIRGLAQSGTLDTAATEDVLLKLGWEPSFATMVAAAWTKPATGSSAAVTSTDLLTLMDGGYMTEPETLAALEAMGYPPADAQQKIDLVTARRVAGAKNTAISDLHSAFKKEDITAAQATAAIVAVGVPAQAAAEIVADWGIALNAGAPPP